MSKRTRNEAQTHYNLNESNEALIRKQGGKSQGNINYGSENQDFMTTKDPKTMPQTQISQNSFDLSMLNNSKDKS